MKKYPGRIRWNGFESECWISINDIMRWVDKAGDNGWDAPTIKLIKSQLDSILLSYKNHVLGMPDDMKKDWYDIMRPN